MKQHLLIFGMLTCFTFNSYAQPTNIYQPTNPNSIISQMGGASSDSLNYYISLGYSPFSVKKIDANNTITQVCDLPEKTNIMFFNKNKGIYKTSTGYSLFDGSSHSAIPTTIIPASYPFNAIGQDYFHKGQYTYFENGKNIFRTNLSSISSIQTLYTSAATTVDPSYYAISKMYNIGNSIYFFETGNPLTPTPNSFKRIDLLTGDVTIIETGASSSITNNNSLYYLTGAIPSGKVKKIDEKGIVSTLYTATDINNSILNLLGVIPNGVIAYTSKNELVLLSGGNITKLNHDIAAEYPRPRVRTLYGKSTDRFVYFEALDTVPTISSAMSIWVTDGTLKGTKKIISKNNYYSGAVSFGDDAKSVSSVVCGDDVYFPGQKTVSDGLNLFHIKGSNFIYSINTSFGNTNQLYKNPSGGIYMIGAPVYYQSAVYKTDCSVITDVAMDNSNQMAFDLFPNPSNGQIKIKLTDNIGNCKFTVTNLLGEQVYSNTINGQSSEFDLNLTTGLYFVILDKNGLKSSKKIIVE